MELLFILRVLLMQQVVLLSLEEFNVGIVHAVSIFGLNYLKIKNEYL